MRKGLLLSFVLAISFMMFFWVGCVHDEIDLVNHTEEFMKEARFYFEENAPGIQLVRLGEDKKEGAKSTSFSSRIIIPDWEKQEAFKFGAISTLEIPLTGDVFYEKFLFPETREWDIPAFVGGRKYEVDHSEA